MKKISKENWRRMNSARSSSPLGVNIIGHISGRSGLGVTVRNLIYALSSAGYDVCALDVDPGHGRPVNAHEDIASYVSAPSELPHSINLFVVAPSDLAHDVIFRPELIELLQREYSINAAIAFWELSHLPPGWGEAMEVFDVIVAGSHFVEGILNLVLSSTHVIHGFQPMNLPTTIRSDRQRFNLPDDEFIVLFSFDPLSDVNRKNPMAALDAFRSAFPFESNTHLVLKINPPKPGTSIQGDGATVLATLAATALADKRIHIIDEALSYPDVLTLYASASVFLSLHRSEGLGLGMLEAMALGKPVIATGWSGNKTFMTGGSACLVAHRLVPVVANNWAYAHCMQGIEAVWAEPDVADAAHWLKRLASDPSLRERIGAAGRKAFTQYQERARQLEFMDFIVEAGAQIRSRLDHTSRLEDISARISRAQTCLRDAGMSKGAPLLNALRLAFDRHIGWRLRSKG